MTDTLIIRITGDSGDGIQLVGEELTITAALAGRDVRTLPDFPAEIRAPAGTVAGVSGFQLAMSEKAIFTAGESLDVLVALNPAALKSSLQYLNQGGLLMVNEDSLQPKDWEKAQCSPELLDEARELHQVLTLPLITNTLRTLESLNVTHAEAKKSKNFYVLGVVLWLFDLSMEHALLHLATKFKKNSLIARANELSLKAGYNYAMTLELSRMAYQLGQVERLGQDYRQITGVEAIALAVATLSVSVKSPFLVSGYPITPSSSILHECAKLSSYGVQLFQAEDEISAICACIGASFGGLLALTCTSGPGLDLKSESLGLAVVAELPLVVIDVQRAGASTGMPTKTGQSDLNQAIYGRHGEAPIPVLAAKSSSDCFYTLIEAFKIATKYMTPVILLLDAYLANAAEPWEIPSLETLDLPILKVNQHPKPYHRDDVQSRSWNIPGTPGYIHQLGGLEKQGEEGHVSYSPENHQLMVNTRLKKISNIAKDYPSLVLEGSPDANILLIGWGSTYGALSECLKEGLNISLLHLRHLNPLPNDLGEILKSYQQVFVAELNTGQLCSLIRSRFLVNAIPITQCTGQPFSTKRLISELKARMTHASANI